MPKLTNTLNNMEVKWVKWKQMCYYTKTI
jgi:hypothetical protein